jgi:hypothetical protein
MGLLRRRGINHFDLAAQSGFIPIPRVFMDRSLLNGFIDRGECFGQELFRLFPIFVIDGCPYSFNACPQDRLILSVDQIAALGSSLLPYCRHVYCHFSLLE